MATIKQLSTQLGAQRQCHTLRSDTTEKNIVALSWKINAPHRVHVYKYVAEMKWKEGVLSFNILPPPPCD